MNLNPSDVKDLMRLVTCSVEPGSILGVGEHVCSSITEDVRERVVGDVGVQDVVLELFEVAVVESRVGVEEVVTLVHGVVALRSETKMFTCHVMCHVTCQQVSATCHLCRGICER